MDNEERSVCTDAQADMCFHWTHMSEGIVSHVASHDAVNTILVVNIPSVINKKLTYMIYTV